LENTTSIPKRLKSRIIKFKSGFKGPFWVANIMELFERLAYYGQATILSIFLRDHLKFSEIEAGQLSSIFGGLIYLLPVFAGSLADKFGFRKAFSFAFLVLAMGYFLIGSTGMELFSGFYSNFNLYWILIVILVFTAIGGSFIKPSVLGTVALTTTKETKSLGYAIYYWLVNMGAAIGPLLAFIVRDTYGIQFVYMVSAISCALMFISTRLFFKEPLEKEPGETQELKTVLLNLLKVLKNSRFIIFLLIFGLYWILFWQFFIIIPFFISDFISPEAPIELILSTGAWTIIALQIPVSWFTKKIPTQSAIVIGFILAALCWLLWYFFLPTSPGSETLSIFLIVLGIFIFSVGEQIQAPRYYEYISELAPKGQVALFQGYAFLPIAFAWGFGGTLGGWLYQTFVTESDQPKMVFITLFFIGVTATVLMFIYNIYLKRHLKRSRI
jgi:proton-dependent oligopeptide transporter, POT family